MLITWSWNPIGTLISVVHLFALIISSDSIDKNAWTSSSSQLLDAKYSKQCHRSLLINKITGLREQEIQLLIHIQITIMNFPILQLSMPGHSRAMVLKVTLANLRAVDRQEMEWSRLDIDSAKSSCISVLTDIHIQYKSPLHNFLSSSSLKAGKFDLIG